MKGRQSGMPAEEYWSSFFNVGCLLTTLECNDVQGDIVEFGCGYGLFTEEAARRTCGYVHAIDIDVEMLQATISRISRSAINNVHVCQMDFLVDGCGLPDQSVAYAMLFNILHIEEPVGLLREAFRALKPGGKAAIVHWIDDPTTPRGPSMDIRPRPEQCQLWAEDAGFRSIRCVSLPCCRFHYGLVASRPM